DGRFLAAKYYQRETPLEYVVWDWKRAEKVVQQRCEAEVKPSIDFGFTPDSRQVILAGRNNGTLGCYDLTSGKETRAIKVGDRAPWAIAVNPDGRRMAVVYDEEVTIRDLESGAALAPVWRVPGNVWQLEWNRLGNLLAAGAGDSRIHLLD